MKSKWIVFLIGLGLVLSFNAVASPEKETAIVESLGMNYEGGGEIWIRVCVREHRLSGAFNIRQGSRIYVPADDAAQAPTLFSEVEIPVYSPVYVRGKHRVGSGGKCFDVSKVWEPR